MICSECGTENKAGDRFCLECGSALNTSSPSEPNTNGSGSTSTVGASRLIRLDGPKQEVYELGNRAVLGRLDTCDLPVDDRSVSREHARLSRLRDGYVVEDLGSTNGTMVNGRRIDEAVILRPGDILTVGSIEFRFEQHQAQEDRVSTDAFPAWSAHPVTPPDGAAAEPASAHIPPTHSHELDQPPQQADLEHSEPPDEARATESHPIVGPPVAETGPVQAVPQAFPYPAPPSDTPVPSAPSENGTGDQGEVIALADRLRDAIHSLAARVDATQNELDTSRERVEDLERQLEDRSRRLDEAEMDRMQLEERARLVEEGGRVHEAIWDALQSTPSVAITDDNAATLHELLDSLAENPRDIGVLLNIADQATAIRQVVDEALQQRDVLQKIRSLVEGN